MIALMATGMFVAGACASSAALSFIEGAPWKSLAFWSAVNVFVAWLDWVQA